jgi:hypothetical protein
MIRNIIVLLIVIAIGATIAYQMGWLSGKGKNVYEQTKESVIENSEKLIDKTRDAVN